MSSRRSVFVIADDSDAAPRIEHALQSSDVEVVAFKSVEAATAALAETRPLVALLWPKPPLSPRLRQPWRTLKAYAAEAGTAVIAVGPRALTQAEEALASGADEYLPDVAVLDALPSRVSGLRGSALMRKPPLRPRTVLLADPDTLWRMRLGDLLENAGHHVLYAGQKLEVEEAIAGLRGPLPEICILDAFAPELGGLEVVRVMRAHPAGRQLPVLVLSGREPSAAELAELKALGAQDLLNKSHLAIEAIVPLIQDSFSSSVRERAPRVSFLHLCRLREETASAWDAGLVYNLSRTGAFVRTLAPLSNGTALVVELDLDALAPCEVAARVAWAHPFQARRSGPPPGMGLQFQGLTEEQRLQVEAKIWPGSLPLRGRPDERSPRS